LLKRFDTDGSPIKIGNTKLTSKGQLPKRYQTPHGGIETVALYDQEGERLHTTHVAAPPEYGKADFILRLEREIKETKKHYPKALYIGVADAAQDNWTFLNHHTAIQVIDFWHVTEYWRLHQKPFSPSDRS